MQNIQKISRLAATAAVGILTCALAAGCKKSDQARVNGTAQNTASSQSLDTTQRASQGGAVSGDSSYATASANPPTGGDSAGLQGNVSANTRTTRHPSQQASGSRETTSSQGGTVPARTTRRTSRRSTAATATASASANTSTANNSTTNNPATVDENSSATMRSNRETGVTSRSAGSTGDTSSASIAAGYAGFLSEPQIYTVVFLANIGDSAASARAICVNPNAPATASAAFDSQVRAFAQQMITDHAQLNQKAAQLQHAQNVIPTRSDVSDQVFTANQDAMGGTENAREYINREVTAHQNLLNTLDTKLIPNARDTSLRRLLVEARGVVQNHLAQAQRLQGGQQTASASVSAANSGLSVSASRDSLSANAHATSQPRPDTIRANSNANMYQPTTPSSSTTMSNAAPAQRDNTRASVSASTPGYPTASASATAGASTSSSLNQTSARPTPSSQQYAVAPAPTSTSTPNAANPCDINNRAANTAPGISPNNMMAPKTDTSRGYDARVTTTPAPARPDTARTTMPRPDTIRTRSDSLRVRIDTGTTRQPQPAPGKP